jgi:hypothetical protein
MIRVNTAPIIAGMANVKALWNRPLKFEIGYPMGF